MSRTRTVLHPRAQEGWFRYSVAVGGVPEVREVNLLDLARRNGQIATTGPLVMRTLATIAASPQITGVIHRAHQLAHRKLAVIA